jgi:hypothetical protein
MVNKIQKIIPVYEETKAKLKKMHDDMQIRSYDALIQMLIDNYELRLK